MGWVSKYTVGRERSSRCRGDRLDEWEIGIILKLSSKDGPGCAEDCESIPPGRSLRGILKLRTRPNPGESRSLPAGQIRQAVRTVRPSDRANIETADTSVSAVFACGNRVHSPQNGHRWIFHPIRWPPETPIRFHPAGDHFRMIRQEFQRNGLPLRWKPALSSFAMGMNEIAGAEDGGEIEGPFSGPRVATASADGKNHWKHP